MKLIDQYKHIHRRADFFSALEEARRRTDAMLARYPGDEHFGSISRQLEAIAGWTAGGRDATPSERRSITIGRHLARGFEGEVPSDVEEWKKYVSEVNGYFYDWFDDQTFQTIDEFEADELTQTRNEEEDGV